MKSPGSNKPIVQMSRRYRLSCLNKLLISTGAVLEHDIACMVAKTGLAEKDVIVTLYVSGDAPEEVLEKAERVR